MRVVACLMLFISLVVAEITLDGSVLVLDDTNWAEALATHSQMLVEFYAPWCGHCKQLAPAWSKAAVTLEGGPVKLAKVDATVATELAKEHGIKGFPTIKYFNKGKPSDYNGGRSESEIVQWVNKKSGPAAKTISTADDLEILREGNDVSVLGVFASLDSVNAKSFLAFAADSQSGYPFAVTASEEIRGALGLTEDTLVVHRSFDEPRVDLSVEAGFDGAAVTKFVNGETSPLVFEFSQKSSKQIFSNPITKHVLFFTDKSAEHHAPTVSTMTALAKEFKGDIIVVNIQSTDENKKVMDFFEVKDTNLPSLTVADLGGDSMKKFPFAGAIEESAVRTHLQQFLAGELKVVLKSEEVAEDDNTGDVVIAKGKTFRDVIINNDKDVFIEFYAPWCGHCKKLAPTWEALGKALKGSDVIVAKMDATANEIDVKGLEAKGYPSLFWIPGNKKTKPVKYDGAREIDDLLEYVKKHATKPVAVATPTDEL